QSWSATWCGCGPSSAGSSSAHCSACVPARVPVASFKPDRGQRRCLKRNQNARVVIKPAVFEEEHYEMYLRYQEYKHEGGEMASAGSDEYLRFLGSSWCDTRFVEFFFQDRLGAVAVLDRFDRAWSAVYTFYEPGFAEFSPGVYAVLWQIAEARRLQIDYLYLGYWIKNCRKMSYKNKYRPLQLYIDGVWVEDSSADV
ncbi:MAG: arginyltransferase, partial [Gammaproteobacteria bacterium]